MRKYLKAILFLAAAVALMSVTALAADGEGICEVETYNSAVTVTPLTAEGTEASENSEGVYVGAVKVQVTYTGAVKDSYYLVLALTFGFTLLASELAIGRKTRRSALHAYGALDKRFGPLGFIASLVPLIILPYYCSIGGWVMK